MSSVYFLLLVIAEESEYIRRKAAEAKVKVAGFACRILLCKGIAEHVDLTSVTSTGCGADQMLDKANPFLYQTLHLENRRSGEHRGEHISPGLRICVFDVTRRRQIRVECPIDDRVLIPLVLQIVDLVICMGIRKVQLSICVSKPKYHRA